MGLLDLFGKAKSMSGGSTPPASASSATRSRVFHEDREKMFDLAQTQVLSELFAVPRERRNAGWQGAFFHAAWTASLEVAEPPAFLGPDHFPYLRLQMPDPHKPFQSNSLGNLARQAVERTSGVAMFVSPQAAEPEYVMSMGVLDSLLTYDSWLGDPMDLAETANAPQAAQVEGGLQQIRMEKSTQILVGSPSATMLPPHTARALYLHMRDGWNLAEPSVALMVNPSIAPTRNLVLNRRLGDFASPQAAGLEARNLLWYFPPGRGLMLMPDSFKPDDMRALTEYFPKQSPEVPE